MLYRAITLMFFILSAIAPQIFPTLINKLLKGLQSNPFNNLLISLIKKLTTKEY
jgi:hypothetical protein